MISVLRRRIDHRVPGLTRARAVQARTRDYQEPNREQNDVTESRTDDEQDDVRSEVELAIADHLARLSESNEAPAEFEAPNPFKASDVDFTSSDWMISLISVQGWLRLRETLEIGSTPDFLKALARGLGFEQPEDAIALLNGQPRLSDAGLNLLAERAERAVELQKTFIEDFEAEGAITAATGRWIEAWEEAPEEEEEGSSGPVTAKAQIWPIQEFSDKAEEGKLNLSPSYQRGDVWPTKDSQMLIESILRGIPLPSVIVLKPQDQLEAQFDVVDGKQRLTAILRFIGRHPEGLKNVREADSEHEGTDLLSLFSTNYPAFRKAWKNLRGEQLTAAKEREYYFPFKLRTGVAPLQGALSDLQGKYYTQIRLSPIEIADDRVQVRQIFERVSEYKIPVIEYSRATRRQIHEVFNLYNKQGMHLNAEEIRNAVYHEVDFVRGLLVTAGDSDDIGEVAPFLVPSWSTTKESGGIAEVKGIEEIKGILFDYGFGTSRYRRTKVLSWLSSLLLLGSPEHGSPKLQSTARHIDSLLDRIQDEPTDPLRDGATIREAFLLMLRGMAAHAAIDEAWDPKFKDAKKGARWQELQLVASLLGVTISASVLGEQTEDRLSVAAPALRVKTATREWQRPMKTQTATQWEYIAKFALLTVEEMGVDVDAASAAMIERFGYSGVDTLKAVRDNDRSK